jgi:hypothetical protein
LGRSKIQPGTVSIEIDCGILSEIDTSDFIYEFIGRGGNQTAELAVQPPSWKAIEFGSIAFVGFN